MQGMQTKQRYEELWALHGMLEQAVPEQPVRKLAEDLVLEHVQEVHYLQADEPF